MTNDAPINRNTVGNVSIAQINSTPKPMLLSIRSSTDAMITGIFIWSWSRNTNNNASTTNTAMVAKRFLVMFLRMPPMKKLSTAKDIEVVRDMTPPRQYGDRYLSKIICELVMQS